MPLLFLSGLSWPVQAMPPLLQALRWLSPSTAGIQGFVALNQMGATLHQVRWELASLMAIGGVAALLGWWRWRRP
jgi:ABC-2 type transport system permease protein